VLSAIVREVVAPDLRDLARTSARLRGAVEEFTKAPAVRALRNARNAWKLAAAAWKRAECVRVGPISTNSALIRAAFWPPRLPAIDAELASGAAFDDASVAALGADVKGLYALEYLLFPVGVTEQAAVDGFLGGAAAARRKLAAAYAGNVAALAVGTERALGDGAGFATEFAAGAGESLGTLVTEIITAIENLAVHRLDLVIRLDKRGTLTPHGFEGGPSRSSHELAAAQFFTSERLYRGRAGGGVAELVRARAPAVAKRVDEHFDAAVHALRALTAPLDELVRGDRPRVVEAVGALKMLEITLKLDVARTLGLTLAFPGGDGD
jgi:predicted lipoprotein